MLRIREYKIQERLNEREWMFKQDWRFREYAGNAWNHERYENVTCVS